MSEDTTTQLPKKRTRRTLPYSGGLSTHSGMVEVREWMKAIDGIHTVVDFGMGRGWLGSQVKLFMKECKIIGCDIYEPVVENARHAGVYDEVYHANAVDFAKTAPRGKGVMWTFGDVLEHIPEEEALCILATAPVEFILVRIPVGPYPQGPHKDNPAEAHLWTFYPRMLDPAQVQKLAIYPMKLVRSGAPRFYDLDDHEEYQRKSSYLGNFLLLGKAS